MVVVRCPQGTVSIGRREECLGNRAGSPGSKLDLIPPLRRAADEPPPVESEPLARPEVQSRAALRHRLAAQREPNPRRRLGRSLRAPNRNRPEGGTGLCPTGR